MKVHTHLGRRGFSLTELLLVIGLIAILLSVAVPSIIFYQRELKLTELDDNARAVFVAAQNHLTALRSASAGELEVSAAVGRTAKAVPSGATEAGTELQYVSTDVTGAEPGWLVLPGSIESDLADGCYLVEFEPKSGSVYGVFFLERGSRVLDESTYEDIYQYASGGNTCRVREGRKAFSKSAGGFYVGYYGSNGALNVDRPDAQTLPQPKLKLINAEELKLEIETESWPTGIEASKVYASVAVSGGGATKTLVREGAINSGTKSTVVLDTLKTSGYNTNDTQSTAGWTVGAPFAKWMESGGGYTITPGSDITVTVSIFYKPGAGEGVVALPQSAGVTTNSLFAARSGETVDVRYGRHLQNLDANTSHLDSAITAAKQVREIDFAKTGDIPYSWAATYPDRAFTAITNANMDRYDGGSLAIRDLKVENASGNAGLFAAFRGSRLENVTLVDAQVKGATAGALAGEIRNAATTTLSTCRVYTTKRVVMPHQIWGSTFAGGLIGRASNCSIQDGSFASTVVYGSNVGGLVGRSEGGVTVANSYAAGHLTGGSNVGGLVGAGSGVTIQDSYAAGTIAKATNKAGGLSADSATVRRSYAAVEYVETPPAESVYGLVPSGSCANAYYLVKLGVNDKVAVSGVTAVTSSERMRKDQGLVLGSAFAEGGNASVMTVPYNLPNQTDGTREPTLSAPYPYPTLVLDAGGSEKTDLTHYGDWLAVKPSDVFLAYFEQYADGTYGYQYPTAAGEENTLRDDKGALRNEGYVLISKEDPKEVKVAGADAGWTKHTDTYTDSLGETYNIYILATDLAQKRHTQAPARYTNASDMPADYGGYCELTVDGNTLWFNPDFAKTTSLTKPAVAARENESIRSIRHFNNMRRYSSDKPDYWTQELDLDGALYEGYQADGAVAGMAVATAADGSRHMVMDTITMVSSGATKDSWGAVYNGGGHAIRHMDIKPVTGVGSKADDQGRTYAGLFGRTINAGVKDLTVENCSVTGEKLGGKDAYTGVLVAYNEGTVENCCAVNCTVSATEGYVGGLLGIARTGTVTSCGVRASSASDYDRYTVSGGAYAGGFVGYESDGVIEHCYAAVRVSGENAGGFAGRLEGAGSIKNSYAGGHTVNGAYSAGVPNVSATKLAGGFAGKRHATELVTLENVYTTCSVAVPKDKTADVFVPEVDQTPGGFAYATGDVYVNGAKVEAGDHNSAKVTITKLPTAAEGAAPAVAYPYDSTLPMLYPFKPVTDAAGGAMIHYGDWHYKAPVSTSSKYEWMPKPEEFSKPNMQNISAEANWNGNTLELEFETFGWATLENWFTTSGGYMAITTDLGYVLPMKVVSEFDYSVYPATITTKLMDANGNVWATEVQTKNGDESTGWQPTRTYKFAISSEVLPPYLETINIGEFKFAPMITDIKNSDPGACTNKPTEEFPPRGKTIVIDGKYSDWTGYPSQLLAYTPGNASITGISYGSAFGRHSTIFVHARNAYTRVEMPFEGKKLQDMPMFKNLPTSVRGDENWADHLSGWHEHFRDLDYTGPDIYEWKELRPDPETGKMVPTVLVQAYVDVQEDGTQEVEMAFYLDRIAGADVADKIDRFQIGFDFGGSLTVERNLDEKDAWADD